MIVVAVAVILSTAVGVIADRRTDRARLASRACLMVMLYVLVPYVAFVNLAHLHLTVGGGVGLGIAYVGLGLAATLAFQIGRRFDLPRPTLGAVIIAVLIANTGYVGYPVAVALLGHGALPHAVAYDQVVSGPILFTVGFAVGAAFSSQEVSGASRMRRFLLNPPLLAAIAGLAAGPSLAPHVMVQIGSDLVYVFLVLGFFTVGVALASERFELPDRAVWLAIVLRFAVNPALLGVVALAGVGIPSAYLLQALMPSGVNGLLIAHLYGLDERLLATTILWTTLAVVAVGTVAYVV